MMRFDRSDDLRGAEFHEVSLAKAQFADVTFEGARFRESYFGGARMSGVQFEDVVLELDADVVGLVINGVEVEPLIEAELDRRHPGRLLLRSEDPDELRAGWSWLEQEWSDTTDDALR